MDGDVPSQYAAVPRILVFGDLHGDIGRFMKALYALRVITPDFAWVAEPPNTVIVQLGDQLDSQSRGSEEDWEVLPDVELVRMMDRLDALARPHGGRVLSLLGNHELMNVQGEFAYVSAKSMSAMGVAARRARFSPGGDLAEVLARRNVVLRIGDYLFCHGGLLPRHLHLVDGNLHRINRLMRRFLRGDGMTYEEYRMLVETVVGEEGILWTRLYMIYATNNMETLHALLDGVLPRLGCKAVFVGHNTVPQITPADGGRCWFVDACFSRAYPNSQMSLLEILGDEVRTLTVQETPKNEVA